MCTAVERRTICKEYFSNGECQFANKGWIVYVLTVLSSSVYPAGSTSSAYWMHSPLFIHSFPRGQVLSFWWMGVGTGQLFSLDRTSLTRSELKRPPCQKNSAIPVLFRSPCNRSQLLTLTQTPAHTLTSLGLFLLEITCRIGAVRLSFTIHSHSFECFMPVGCYGVCSSFWGGRWESHHAGCVGVV